MSEDKVLELWIDACSRSGDPAAFSALTYESGAYSITKVKQALMKFAELVAAQPPAEDK